MVSGGNGVDSDNSGGMEDADKPVMAIKAGDHLGNDLYVLCVKHVLNRSTHVVVDVVKSTDNNFVAGVERILTMDHALLLYHEYYDL
jgi:hypothetical protein